jgi:hypothetical protein
LYKLYKKSPLFFNLGKDFDKFLTIRFLLHFLTDYAIIINEVKLRLKYINSFDLSFE